ncbi:heme ABC transporter permease [Yunchengibacter salinarum]|uniref:heme ABC transporter permease n=1 Tax=Yunchengibacter salinarum TaxID=3133399 RepID=UPI0035B63F41
MHALANPARFNRLSSLIRPWAFRVMAGALAVGLYAALVTSPADYQQGDSVRIMYVHVPAAWMALFVYMVMAVASFAGLVWRHPLALLAGKAAAPVGAAFTFLALATGALWGKPMWGTYWVWDGRLTSMLILFFLYLAYMALWSALDDHDKAGRAAAILALVGTVNIPVIKFSVDWWHTLHQPASVMRLDGPTIDGSMLWPLLIMALAFKAYFIWLFLGRLGLELDRRKLDVLRMNRLAADRGRAQ